MSLPYAKTWNNVQLMRIPVTIIHAFGITATCFRLYQRHRTRRLWWDDFWAFVSLILDALYLATFWLRNPKAGVSPPHIKIYYIVLHWFTIMLGTSVVWTARLSMVTTIRRVLPPSRNLRLITLAMVVIFCVLWAVVLVEKIWICAPDTSWHTSPSVQCYLGDAMAITQLIVSLLSDGALVAVPFHFLWRVRLPEAQRRLVLSIFASSLVTTLASVIYITFLFGSMKWKTFLMVNVGGHIEAATSLLVCNLLVLVTFIYRFVNRTRNTQELSLEEPDHVTPWRTKRPTTVVNTVTMSFPTGARSDMSYGSTFDLPNLSAETPSQKTQQTDSSLSTSKGKFWLQSKSKEF